jgi:type IV pilus assembly protein PilB
LSSPFGPGNKQYPSLSQTPQSPAAIVPEGLPVAVAGNGQPVNPVPPISSAPSKPSPEVPPSLPSSPVQAKAPMNPQVKKGPKRIGDVLIEEGFINPQQLERALSEGKATGAPLGVVLIKLGYIDEIHLGKALAKLHGLQYIDTSTIQLKPEVMCLIPKDFIKRHMVLPLSVDIAHKRMEVIMARPDNLSVLDEIALLTGYRPIPRVSTHKEMLGLLDKFYDTHASSDEVLARLEEDLSKDSSLFAETTASELEVEMAADDAPVVQLVNSILIEAIDSDASDVHIEPQKERLLVRFRIHGILREVKSIPKKMAGAVTSRIKVASGMDIAERRRPQDGRMKIKAGSQDIDMRVNSLAVQFGEKIVIRLLRPNATTGGLEKLGLPREEVKRINKMIKSPHGIILVTGPTGSGKTTTLYSCLREINSPERNITTIEDPVEYPLSGVNQTQVSSKSGLTFALCLRAILRQDPDVVMVGEIRDEETLESAIHAALTGHLVFSTLHTNSTAKTVIRLLEMGAPSYLVSSAVIGILAQRLVRRNCSKCKISYEATPEELQILGIENPDKPVILQKGTGCERCGNSGYEGRIGLYEIMNMNREIGELIEAKASSFVIQDAAVKAGMLTLGMDGKRKIFAGLTTVDEVTRVLGLDLEES